MSPYIADLRDAAALEVAFVRSPLPHARITRLKGACATSRTLGLEPISIEGPGLHPRPWPVLGGERVLYVGEPVAAVWAADRYQAEDAAEEIEVDYEPLAAEAPTLLFEHVFAAGSLPATFGRADRILERTFRAARQVPLPLEGRGVLAIPEGAGVTLWTSTQVPHIVSACVSRALGLEPAAVRVRVPDVGGGFGLKAHVFAEEITLAALARRLGRPVRWIEDRQENLIAGSHAHDNQVRLRVAVSRDGRVLAAEAEVRCDAGAYSIYPFSASLEPMTAGSALFAPYSLEAIRFEARAFSSHRCPVGAYRGVGTNTAVFATERMLDEVARELGLDPLEVRRRNALPRLPHVTLTGRRLDSGDYLGLLDLLESGAGYRRLRQDQMTARQAGRLVGVGLALFNEHSGTGASEYRDRGVHLVPGTDSTRVRIDAGGRLEVYTSSVEVGQRHGAGYRAIAARELGVSPDLVDVIEGDTERCPPGTGAFVSRGGVGVFDSLVQALRAAAERDLQPGTDVTRTADPRQVYPSGAHLALVEIDPLTYSVRVLRYIAVEDCGTVIDPEAVEQQLGGGVAMGIGKVLLEQSVYGDDGQVLSASLLDYLVPLAADVPAIEIAHLVTPSPHTILGSKGVGEAGTVGAFGAVANAVSDAISPLGGAIYSLPCSPAAIFEAMAEPLTPRN